ncbi:MAG: choline dehydrogenase-like flavoprotein [Anaerocolumna sp.]|jgi:choline dehydrogenase-like flavoprotein|nr:choline dehydrogenase-like flavoprotein [Anaerocolumna sp.]
MNHDAEVIVIGAGGGGAVVAKELGEKGIKVLVLEAGAWYGNKKWPNPNTDRGAISSSSYDDLSIEILSQQFTDLEDDMNDFVTGKFRWGPANRDLSPWARVVGDRGYTWQNAGVGGSTLHYYGNSPRAYPSAVNDIWPISYDELVPYYERVEATLPVWPAPTTGKEDLFYYGLRKSGWQLLDSPNVTTPGYRPQPNAILRPNQQMNDPNFNFEDNTSIGCTLRGHCVNGCHIGPTIDSIAKRSTFASYIPRALLSGNVEVRPNTFVTKIVTEEDPVEGLRIVGVNYRDTWTGEIGELRADVVVMSCGGIESPRLWLNSQLPENEWVGKGLINHWFDCVSGIFEEKDLMNVLGQSDIKPYVGQNAAARFDYPGLGVIEPFGMSPGLQATTVYGTSYKGYHVFHKTDKNVPWDIEGLVVGEQLKDFMRQYNRTLSLLIFTDDDVNQNNSVTLDPVRKDENGYIPVIHYVPSSQDKERRDQLATIASEILRNAGAKTIIRSDWPPEVFLHIQSTMRIGYVTDSNCEAKQVKRLYIADNSVLFNGLGGPNPTMTNQALATRTAEKIVEKYFS